MLPLLVLLGTIAGAWYLLIVRPQKDQLSRHGELVQRLQVGDHVLTVGGIYGRVVGRDASTVELELAPGLTSRIATDGIARIVHAGEAPPLAAQAPPTRQATEPTMHQHPHQHPQPPAQPQPQYAPPAPPQPYAPAQVAMPPHHVMAPPAVPQHVQPVQYAPQGVQPHPAPAHATTLRAQVVPQQQPWAGIAPHGQAPAPQVVQHAPGSFVPAQVASTLPPAPQIVVRTPFAPAPAAPAAPVQAAQPAPVPYAAPAPVTAPVHAPVQYAPPAPMPVQYAAPAPVPAPVQFAAPAPVAPAAPGRRASRAPQGMGSSLRLDDPSIRDTVDRARTERAGLAAEYRKHVAPLVDTSPAGAAPVAPPPAPAPLPPGAPALFVSQEQQQHPAPTRAATQHAGMAPSALPRPTVTISDQPLDTAFQRRTPFSPRPEDEAVAPLASPFANQPAPATALA